VVGDMILGGERNQFGDFLGHDLAWGLLLK
jgi:hypothetical protein